MQRKIFGLFIILITVVFMGCSNSSTDTPDVDTPESVTPATGAAINLVAISGVVPPVRDARAVTTAIDTAQYTGTITWSPAASQFAATTVYTATIVLTVKEGYTLTGVAANSFTVAGATATNAANSGTVTAVFPKTLSFGLTMVTVPAGSFQRDNNTLNISKISTDFQMSKYEIIRTQFLEIMGEDPGTRSPTMTCGTDDPVFLVNWYHAIAFCNKLSIAEGLAPVYAVNGVNFTTLTFDDIPSSENSLPQTPWYAVTATWTNDGYRLPTEMEWAWSAMGATSDARPGDIVGGVNTGGYTKA